MKVLMVEDDSLLRELLSKKLIAEGFEVAMVLDPEKGLQLAHANPPDLILLDYILPGMGGPEMLSIMQNDSDLKSIPVIMLSNVGSKEEINRMLQMGVRKYLVKYDVTLKQVVEEIKQVLGIEDPPKK